MFYCKICHQPNCKKHSFLISKFSKLDKFSGSSPPEIFIGHQGYPNVNIGILSPIKHGDNKIMSSPELWHKNNFSISQIIELRKQLICGKTKAHIKTLSSEVKKFHGVLQEIALTDKSVSAEFKLNKPIITNKEKDSKIPLIANSAFIKYAKLQENPVINPKIESFSSDTDIKSKTAILELEKYTSTSHIIKMLSAGLLGQKTKRKFVPTRWAITAVDDLMSKNKLKKIKYMKEIQEISVFHSEYLGNHYEFLLLPDKWYFEVIEISLNNEKIWRDYESFFERKNYAESVTGAYYANRLALTEYLEKIQRQASCLVIREILPEYTSSIGVGILRETSRQAFQNPILKFNTLNEALRNIQTRLHQPLSNYINQSRILQEYNKQKRLDKFFNLF